MSINKSCELLGYTRQAYFKALKNQISKEKRMAEASEFIIDKVKIERTKMPKIGGLKLFQMIAPLLQAAGFKIGRDKFIEILQQHNYLIIRKKKYYKTTDSNHWLKKYDNLIKEIIPHRPEQIWVADITHILTVEEGAVYGHVVTDAYSKKIMGIEISDDMKATSTAKALKMAIKNRIYDEELIHHSDRGSQYCSAAYTKILKKKKIKISMTQEGSPYDNAIAERINGILKYEFGLGDTLRNLYHVKEVAVRAVDLYNNERPHWSNSLLTPNRMHLQQELEIVTWKKKTITRKNQNK